MSNLSVYFGRDTRGRWSLLSGVYARGSKRSNTRGEFVTCRGLYLVNNVYMKLIKKNVKVNTITFSYSISNRLLHNNLVRHGSL